ncbi:MAG: winged helix-turn-helix domain-containing protein [Pirellulales bacterium]
MSESDRDSFDEGESVSARLPTTKIEAAALRPVISDLLQSIPATWAEFDFDKLTALQSKALFLLTAAGMVERRGWIRATIANYPTCFEVRFQATGEGGFCKAMESATILQFQAWGDAWRKWREGELKDRSPFHAQAMEPQEWRMTDHGESARSGLNPANPEADPNLVFDFVLKRGFFGPGYWMRRGMTVGRPPSVEEQRSVENLLAAGHDLAQLPRPPVGGSGQLLEIRKVDPSGEPQAVQLTNWDEGASAFADAFDNVLGPMFERMNKAPTVAAEDGEDLQPSSSPASTSDGQQCASPTSFCTGEMVFLPDRILFCEVEICIGQRSMTKRRLLALLAKKDGKGNFIAYSGQELAILIQAPGGNGTVVGAIRDLRTEISATLLNKANCICGREDVILSGGPGYRLSHHISVQYVDDSAITDTTDMDDESDVSNDDVRDVFNVRDDTSGGRRNWILQQLSAGVQLKAPMVAERFGCSAKTAQRDLTALKGDGLIEYEGASRTGYYRLCSPPRTTG